MRKYIVCSLLFAVLLVAVAPVVLLAQDDTGDEDTTTTTTTTDPTPTPNVVGDTPEERLPANGAGTIENGLVYPAQEWINMRPEPTGYPGEELGKDVVARLYWGDVVEVLNDPPQCVDGYTWYKMRLIQRGDGNPVDPRPEGWVAAKVQTKSGDTITERENPCCSAVITVGGGIYLRDAPNDNGNLIWPPIANYGTTNFYRFTVTSQTPTWVHIVARYPGLQGWTRKSYLTYQPGGACEAVESLPDVTTDPTPTICTVKAVIEGGIWFRAEPSFAAERIGSFLPGVVLVPLERRQEGPNTWWRVRDSGLEGWVLADGAFYEFSGDCTDFLQ